jgi:hypothetical protein
MKDLYEKAADAFAPAALKQYKRTVEAKACL